MARIHTFYKFGTFNVVYNRGVTSCSEAFLVGYNSALLPRHAWVEQIIVTHEKSTYGVSTIMLSNVDHPLTKDIFVEAF